MPNSSGGGFPLQVREECDLHLKNGQLDDAVLTALKWTEMRLSWATGRYPRPIGVAAIRAALAPNNGTVRFGGNREQQGMSDLLCGLMSLYRNPAAHSFPVLSLAEANSVIDLAEAQLVRISRGTAEAAAVALGAPVSEVALMAIADLDGDGQSEMLVTVLTSDGKPSRIAVLKNGTHGYLARVLLEDADEVLGVEARDIDHDGRHEVLLYDSGGGPGTWLSILRWSPDRTESIARIGSDLSTFIWSQPDGDGKLQLLVTGRTFGEGAAWRRELRTFTWGGGEFAEIKRSHEPWSEG